jgi:hypothetical protein
MPNHAAPKFWSPSSINFPSLLKKSTAGLPAQRPSLITGISNHGRTGRRAWGWTAWRGRALRGIPYLRHSPTVHDALGTRNPLIVFSLAQHELRLDMKIWLDEVDPRSDMFHSCDLWRLIIDLDYFRNNGKWGDGYDETSRAYNSTCQPNALRICVEQGEHLEYFCWLLEN